MGGATQNTDVISWRNGDKKPSSARGQAVNFSLEMAVVSNVHPKHRKDERDTG